MTIFTDKVKKYEPRLEADLSITKEQACGIFGNLGTETGGFTALQEKRPVIAGSRGGYGWMQWTGPRRRKYEDWCKKNTLDPAADETNYQYLVFETKTDEKHSLEQLRKTTTIEAATETFMKQNLRPGAPHLENRISWAKQAQNALVSQTKATTQVAAGAGTIAVGTVVATQVQPHHLAWAHDHWFLLAALTATAVGLIIWGVHRYFEHQKQDVVELVAPTKKRVKK